MSDLNVKEIVSEYFDFAYAVIENIYQDEPLRYWHIGLWKKDMDYTYNFYLALRIFPDQMNVKESRGGSRFF